MASDNAALRNSACVEWQGSRDRHGYGYSWHAGTRTYAHRAAWEAANGRALIPGEVVCHSCDNPSCCNPDHLWAGSQRDNMRDMYAKGRGAKVRPSGELCGNAKLSVQQAAAILADDRSTTEIARTYGVGRSAVRSIKLGQTWARDIAAHLEAQHG